MGIGRKRITDWERTGFCVAESGGGIGEAHTRSAATNGRADLAAAGGFGESNGVGERRGVSPPRSLRRQSARVFLCDLQTCDENWLLGLQHENAADPAFEQ